MGRRLSVTPSVLLPGILWLGLGLASSAEARTWCVSPDGSGDSPTIQAAVDSAAPGDTVLLADGIFTGDGNWNIDFGGKDLTLRSAHGRDHTTVECGSEDSERRAFVFQNGETSASRVEGIKIQSSCWVHRGACIYCSNSSPTIAGCSFSCGTGLYGTCMYCVNNSSPTITHCIALECGNENTGFDFTECHPTITDCVFDSNNYPDDGPEGCILSLYRSPGTVARCVFTNNYTHGACIWCHLSDVTVSDCVFIGNRGYVCPGVAFPACANPVVERCVFAHGEACVIGAVYAAHSSALISNTTMYANSVTSSSERLGTIYCCGNAHLTVTNTIIAGGSGGPPVVCDPGATMVLACCDVHGNAEGDWVGCIADQYGVSGNFCALPGFCRADVEPYDFRLCDDSCCLPGNHPGGYDCGLIGALGEGCHCPPNEVRPSTWGSIKSMYR